MAFFFAHAYIDDGLDRSFIQVPFLNLMQSLQDRAGRVDIRVGGNTQETATLVEGLSGARMVSKDVMLGEQSNPVRSRSLQRAVFALTCYSVDANTTVVVYSRGTVSHGEYIPVGVGWVVFRSDSLSSGFSCANQVHIGIPMNDTTHLRLGIVEAGQRILGNHLLGFQVGNEPDLYVRHVFSFLTPIQAG